MRKEAEAPNPTLSGSELTETLRLLGEIDEFKGYWRKLKELRAERLGELRKVATIESSGSSTRIEGAELTDEQVAQVLSGLSVDAFSQRDASEVRGYGELLQAIFDSHETIPLEERFIQQLHSILLAHSERDAWHRGRYKKDQYHLEARHPDGRVEVLFHTSSPFETPGRMAELIAATEAARELGEVHPLVVVARFIVEFLAIHPFQDGNGRLSRAVTTLLLLRAGYEYVPYASLERVVEDNKTAYYAALRSSQVAMRDAPTAYGAWLLFFLRSVRAQQKNLLAKLDVERSMVRLSEVQQRILDMVDDHGSVTSSVVAGTLDLPPRTVRYHLDVLIRHGLVVPRGEKRGRTYQRATGEAQDAGGQGSKTAAILADILERSGRIGSNDLKQLVEAHGYDPRVVGTLHGKRLAHLRRNRGTGESELTSRGREVAEQHLFARRLAEGARHS
ncbi:MAG: Fic family protein [Gemmatimonadota bacterium]